MSDRGVRGLVVGLTGELATVRAMDDVLYVGGGMKNVVLLSRARAARWPGLQCLAGIPGTLGGAVRMNAGASLGEISDILIDVDLALPSGRLIRMSRDELNMSYRTCRLPAGAVVTEVRLQSEGDFDEGQAAIRAHLERRKQTQPLDRPSGGSTFRNPPGDHAGRLIEAAGLKGHQIGGAQVSEKHANFIVNLGDATSDDVRAVIETVQRAVAQRFNVHMEREVHYAGDWSHWTESTA